MTYDNEVWPTVDVDDLWLYDKLILSKKLGYTCGPAGVEVPEPNTYIIRPITNIEGMGQGAYADILIDKTTHLSPGYFWCEYFMGRHLSVDYTDGKQIFCAEGFGCIDFTKWFKWERATDIVSLPSILEPFVDKYPHMNCEFVGDKLIEVHLRHSSDFPPGVDVLYPVWEGDDATPPDGMKFIPNPDYKRLGFFIPID